MTGILEVIAIGHVTSPVSISKNDDDENVKKATFTLTINRMKGRNHAVDIYECSMWNKSFHLVNSINEGDYVYVKGDPSETIMYDHSQMPFISRELMVHHIQVLSS